MFQVRPHHPVFELSRRSRMESGQAVFRTSWAHPGTYHFPQQPRYWERKNPTRDVDLDRVFGIWSGCGGRI